MFFRQHNGYSVFLLEPGDYVLTGSHADKTVQRVNRKKGEGREVIFKDGSTAFFSECDVYVDFERRRF